MAVPAGMLRRCTSCNRRDRWSGFADETIRNKRYGIAVVLACGCQHDALRGCARSLRLRGQHRLHMSKEQARRRRLILSTVRDSGLRALYHEVRGVEHTARATCWTELIPHLVDLDVRTLAIEALDGSEIHDRANISAALAKADALGRLSYVHRSHRDEPLLWFADAVAWAAGYRGEWLTAVRDVLLDP